MDVGMVDSAQSSKGREVQVLRRNNSSTSESMYHPTEQKRHKQIDMPKILLINEVVISKHSRASPGSLLMTTVLTRVEHMRDMSFLLIFSVGEKKSCTCNPESTCQQHQAVRTGGC